MKKFELTLEHVEEACKYIFNNTRYVPPERIIKMSQSCKSFGTVTTDSSKLDMPYCSDKECNNCNTMWEMFRAQALKITPE